MLDNIIGVLDSFSLFQSQAGDDGIRLQTRVLAGMNNLRKFESECTHSSSLGLAMDNDDWVRLSSPFGWLQPLDIHLLAKDVTSIAIICIAATGIEKGANRSDF